MRGISTKLNEIYNAIPESTCPNNCGKCCGILYPSIAELRNIYDWCQKHHIEYKEFPMTVGLNCPYLAQNKKCVIYPVRPFLCRILGVSIDLPCPIKKLTSMEILNHAQSSYLYKQIYLKGKEKPRTEKHRKFLEKYITTGGLSNGTAK